MKIKNYKDLIAAQDVIATVNNRCRSELKLSFAALRILKIVDNHDFIRLTHIADHRAMSQQATGKMLRDLCARKLVSVRTGKHDNRETHYSMTPQGIAMLLRFEKLLPQVI